MPGVLTALIAAIALQAAPGAAQPGPDGEPIVVTGRRIQDQRDALAACLARRCPPNEDIDATLGLAEMLFEAGDYAAARRAIRASIGRNRRHAATYTLPVSDLYRAQGRVARHMGEDREARVAAINIMETLERGLGEDDHRLFGARLEYADTLLGIGQGATALRELESLRRDARRAGRRDVAAMAELRSLWVQYVAMPHGPARARLAERSRSTDPDDLFLSVGARILLASIYRREGDSRRADALLAEIVRTSGGARVLVHEPPYRLQFQPVDAADDRTVAVNELRNPELREGTWIDVGFWVDSAGRVSELQIVRQGASPAWAEPLLEAIRGRRYTPSADGRPTYRLERYTYTSGYEARTGSLLRQRSARGRVEYLDLSPGAGAEPPRLPSSSR